MSEIDDQDVSKSPLYEDREPGPDASEEVDPLGGNAAGDDEFETEALDNEEEVDHRRRALDDDPVARLEAYLRDVTHKSYRRSDFDFYLDAAKRRVQDRNYRKSNKQGYLAAELRRLLVHVERIPLILSGLVLLAMILAGTYAASRVLPEIAGEGDAQGPSVTSLLIMAAAAAAAPALAAIMAVIIGKLAWHVQFTRLNAGVERARDIRYFNHNLLMNKIKSLLDISVADAQNKEPRRGSDGLLKVYLLFICGYVLHKTLNRCYTRFAEDFEEIHLTRIRHYRRLIMLAGISVGAAALAVFAVDALFPTVSGAWAAYVIVICMAVPLATAWMSFVLLTWRARRRSGSVHGQLVFMQGLYKTYLPEAVRDRLKTGEDPGPLYEFPEIYAYNEIEDYIRWLHETLSALKRHHDMVRPP